MADARTLPSPDPAGPDEDLLLTGEAVALDLRPTGYALRAAGTAIDAVLAYGLYILILLGAAWITINAGLEQATLAVVGVVALVLCFVVLPATIEVATRGRSLGRLAVGARIVREDGGAIGFRHATVRALVGVIEIFLTLGGIAAIVGLLSDRGRRLGDLVAGTYSQYERVGRPAPPAFGMPPALARWARTADVGRLPDPLARRIAQFLTQTRQLTPERRRAIAAQLAAEATPFVAPVPAADPELFLAAVAVIRREREFAALQLEAERLARLEPLLRGRPHAFPERG